MSDTLPLPEPYGYFDIRGEAADGFLADQMRAYAAAAVAAERERCQLAVHDAVMRALDEAGVYASVLRGMCVEVAMERFSEACTTAPQRGELKP